MRDDHIDREMLSELKEIMEDDFTLLLNTYLEESSAQYAAADAAFQGRDFSALNRNAHALKGSCANVGAAQCAEICQQLETAALQPEPPDVGELLGQLRIEMHAVHEVLQAELNP